MRIAQIAPLHEAVPPILYGGTERIVSYLTEALVSLGHDVTLFASGDSSTSARLEPAWPRSLRLDPGTGDVLAPHLLLLEKVRRVAHTFDVLHFHLSYLPLPTFSLVDVPFLTTLHGRLDQPELQAMFDMFPQAPVVSISRSQRIALPNANWIGTVYHGLPENLLTPHPHTQPTYLAFLGRISAEKGVDVAIEIAARAGLPLKIAAKVDRADEAYFRDVIQPRLLRHDVEFIGEISDAQKAHFLAGARALLFPIEWSEPFGLVMIEAMACGTPVIAFNRGSVPEVISHGVTGYIVDDVPAAVDAVKRLDALSRGEIRSSFVRCFSSTIMAQRYMKIYVALAQAAKPPALRQIASG
ncbi:glycosyltransferase family 4 protein [Paraburkholderia rhizosphaerae]|uniref:Glycosyltransferase involved in cell wall biosynthesis n=1 Tax=Paraburkholderia rhizosphaerae TaxID=480658 RepID=A0A4R8LZD8_9BURK|nr:glycosyltransferase family 4 protein [Paraburkholderia rhizosphaerae]TDY54018.1 glycosyltransferase involved in cell wall biosynthesis [Paraburkholderia rhizosphaerae]